MTRTFQQLMFKKKPQTYPEFDKKIVALEGAPFRKGVVTKLFIQNPKKPNSANRRVARVRLSTGISVNAFIPGGKNNLSPHSTVLVRAGNKKDLPGVKYTLIRGKYDLEGCPGRMQSRSKYGTKKAYHTGTLGGGAFATTTSLLYNTITSTAATTSSIMASSSPTSMLFSSMRRFSSTASKMI